MRANKCHVWAGGMQLQNIIWERNNDDNIYIGEHEDKSDMIISILVKNIKNFIIVHLYLYNVFSVCQETSSARLIWYRKRERKKSEIWQTVIKFATTTKKVTCQKVALSVQKVS